MTTGDECNNYSNWSRLSTDSMSLNTPTTPLNTLTITIVSLL